MGSGEEFELQLLKTQKNLLVMQQKIYNADQELIYANNFHDTIKGSEWLPEDFSFSPCRWALGYPALYVLYRILNEIRPESILEMGLGQSTKLIGMYNRWNKKCRHTVVEHDDTWIDFFSKNFILPDTTEILHLPMIEAQIEYNRNICSVHMYEGFSEHLKERKFDLICIDGPFGAGEIARIDLVGILPECLAKSFLIILDDCDRQGESNAFELFSQILCEHDIEHYKAYYQGEKETGIIMSKDYRFIGSL